VISFRRQARKRDPGRRSGRTHERLKQDAGETRTGSRLRLQHLQRVDDEVQTVPTTDGVDTRESREVSVVVAALRIAISSGLRTAVRSDYLLFSWLVRCKKMWLVGILDIVCMSVCIMLVFVARGMAPQR